MLSTQRILLALEVLVESGMLRLSEDVDGREKVTQSLLSLGSVEFVVESGYQLLRIELQLAFANCFHDSLKHQDLHLGALSFYKSLKLLGEVVDRLIGVGLVDPVENTNQSILKDFIRTVLANLDQFGQSRVAEVNENSLRRLRASLSEVGVKCYVVKFGIEDRYETVE